MDKSILMTPVELFVIFSFNHVKSLYFDLFTSGQCPVSEKSCVRIRERAAALVKPQHPKNSVRPIHPFDDSGGRSVVQILQKELLQLKFLVTVC